MVHVEQLEPRRLMAFSASNEPIADEGDAAPLDAAGRVVNAPNVLVQPSGRIVVAGTFEGKWALRRYRPDGSLDESFGDDGIVKNLNVREGRISLLAEASDGGFYLVGRGFFKGDDRSGRDDRDLLIAKVKGNGRLNKSFRPDGADRKHPGFIRIRANADVDLDEETLGLVRSGRRLAFSEGDGLLTGGGFGSAMGPTDLMGSISPLHAAVPGAGSPQGQFVNADGTFDDEELVWYAAGALPYVLRIGPGGTVTAGGLVKADTVKRSMANQAGAGIVPRRLDAGPARKVSADTTANAAPNGDGGAARPLSEEPAAGEFVAQLPGVRHGSEVELLGGLNGASARDASAADEIPIESTADDLADATDRLHEAMTGIGKEPRTVGTANANEVRARQSVDPPARALADVPADQSTREMTRADSRGASTFDAVWRNDARADRLMLNADDDLLVTATLQTLTVRVQSKTSRGGGTVVVRHRPAPVESVAQPQAEDGRYHARELGKRIADVTGALAVGRTLGTFAVRVPKPILTTSSLAAAMSRERQRLAPNT